MWNYNNSVGFAFNDDFFGWNPHTIQSENKQSTLIVPIGTCVANSRNTHYFACLKISKGYDVSSSSSSSS